MDMIITGLEIGGSIFLVILLFLLVFWRMLRI